MIIQTHYKKRSFLSIASGALALVTFAPQLVAAAGFTYEVKSPLKSGITSIEGLLTSILNIFILIATPIIVLFIIYAGFLYVTAQGNAQQVQQATRALTYAVIGAVLVIGSVALSQIVGDIVGAFSK